MISSTEENQILQSIASKMADWLLIGTVYSITLDSPDTCAQSREITVYMSGNFEATICDSTVNLT